MKALSKRLFAFFMVFCMIVPMCAQSVSAADCAPNSGIPEGCVKVSEGQTAPPTIDSIEILESDILDNDGMTDDNISPYLTPDRDMGVGVRRIRVYPLGCNLETGDVFVSETIYKQASYVNYSQTHGIELTKSETLSLMTRMQNVLSAAGENYYLCGWVVISVVEFDYSRPQYVLAHRCGTGIDTTTEEVEKRTFSASEPNQSFGYFFLYPSGIDVLSDYYYVGISGGCYYTGTSGGQGSAMFGAYVSFNH